MTQLLKYHISRLSGLYLGGAYSWLGKKKYDCAHEKKPARKITDNSKVNIDAPLNGETSRFKLENAASKHEREIKEIVARRQKDPSVGCFGGMFILPTVKKTVK